MLTAGDLKLPTAPSTGSIRPKSIPRSRHRLSKKIKNTLKNFSTLLVVKSAVLTYSRAYYAFDPRRIAILLIGGNKTGDRRFYEQMIPMTSTWLSWRKEKNDGR